METLELQRKYDRTEAEIEALREKHSGTFSNTMGHMVKGKHGIWTKEQTSFPEVSQNIVTNEGLDHVLDVQLNALTNLLVWYLTGFTANVTPLATHDYAADGVTELTTTNVAEAVRETYNANAASGQSIDNVGSVAQYIADEAFTFWGAMLKTGNNSFTDVTNDSVHILWSSSLLGSSKSMVALDTIDLTYTFTAADA